MSCVIWLLWCVILFFFFLNGLFAVGFLAHVQALSLMFLLACKKTLRILPEFSPRAPTPVLLDSKEAKVVFCFLFFVFFVVDCRLLLIVGDRVTIQPPLLQIFTVWDRVYKARAKFLLRFLRLRPL